jgi:predicted cupin superfamily sugar epimerase
LIRKLELIPHPEGGHYRETFRDEAASGRAHSTAIYFLLRAGEMSRWHRVDSAEIWHWYAGTPLALSIADGKGHRRTIRLGPDVMAGEVPQAVVPRYEWQRAQSLGEYSLVGCTVAPGFEFAGFEMAPPDFDPA